MLIVEQIQELVKKKGGGGCHLTASDVMNTDAVPEELKANFVLCVTTQNSNLSL